MKKSYSDIRKDLASGQSSCEAIVQDYFRAIEQHTDLNAWITVADRDATLVRAQAIDLKLRSGTAGRLAGMAMAVKDAIVVKDLRHTAGSRILADYVSPYSATVIERLMNEDAIVLGKANMDEFAMGSSNENSGFGPVLNPVDRTRVPGGSSGGSAVTVAAGMATAALGSETGGSVRLPASFCGIVGLKPTYGRISRYGLTAFASSFDQIGAMATTVEDVARVTQCIAGYDALDPTTSQSEVPDYAGGMERGVERLRIGVPKEYFSEGIQPEVEAAVRRVIRHLADCGADIVDVSLPHTAYGIATYYVLVTAEASSNLARYDGVRYTHRSKTADTTRELYVHSRSEGFGPEVKRRIMLGTYVLSAGYYDAYYRKAQKVRTLIKQDFLNVFAGEVDCLIAPTSPTVAFHLGEKLADPLTMYLSDVYTVNTNIAGMPALSVPCGRNAQGLPIGVQVIANDFDEGMCFRVGRAIEHMNVP